MKKLMLLALLVSAPGHVWGADVLYSTIISHTTSAQSLTTTFADFGGEESCRNLDSIGLWIDVDNNGGANTRVRALAKTTGSTTLEYDLPINGIVSEAAGVVGIDQDNYFELEDDADQQVMLRWNLDGLCQNKVQFQISVSSDGGNDNTEGAILTSFISKSRHAGVEK